MKEFLYFCVVMILGFLVFVPWLVFVVPYLGIKVFVIGTFVLILGLLLELFLNK